MKTVRGIGVALLAAAAWPAVGFAGELKQVGTIDVPGAKLSNFDISYVDPATGRYYLADRSNKAIDIFDTAKDSYLGRVGSFTGTAMKDGKVDNAASGPDGVVAAGGEVWAGDGDGTLKVIDLASGETVATLNSGGATRVDEMAYDPKDHVVIAVNNAEDPPFATMTSTEVGHAVVGKVVFADAGDGAEQPAYDPDDGMFYMSIPQVGTDPRNGAVAVIDPRTGKLVRMLPVDGCHPAGLAFGPGGNFVLGCNANGKEMPAQTVVMNAGSGAIVATVPGIGGSDMVNYNARNGQYYTASRENPGGPALGVIDARTNKLVQTIPLRGGNPHSVTSSESNGHVYVPVGAGGGGDGTIHVFSPAS